MDYSEFYIDKSTGTPTDALIAYAWGRFLLGVIPEEAGDIGLTIADVGDAYQVSLKQPLREEWVRNAPFRYLLRALDTKTKRADTLPPAQRVDYLQHQENNRLYYEALKDRKQTPAALAEMGLTGPVPDWPAWAKINQMSAVDAYNGLIEQWYAHRDCFPDLLAIVLNLFATRPNDVAAAEAAWLRLAKAQGIDAKATAARLQVVNPGMGKGGNRSKADGLTIGGLDGFWLLEYLKYAGLFLAAIPRTVKGSKDRKTYVLYPRRLTWNRHQQVFPEFQKTLFQSTAVRMDVLAVLQYCRVFLEQWKAGQASGRFARFRGEPGNHVAAIGVIYYKHLGSAHATMNLSTLALPLWLSVETIEQAQAFIELLEEHISVIRGLDESHADAYQLLLNYRNFLSGQDLHAFFQFTRAYSGYVMRKMAAGDFPPRRFTIPHLEVLIMAHNRHLSPILEDPGFRRIAEAIRRSTVSLQYQKSHGGDLLYEIRYGLGDKLLRHAQYADEFAAELSRFTQGYNEENARKAETRKQQRRTNITIDDLAAVVRLIDEYGAPTVANLLVAFGYARDPHTAEREQTDEPTEPEPEMAGDENE